MIPAAQLPSLIAIKQILQRVTAEDLRKLERVYKYELYWAKLEEYHKVRFFKAGVEMTEWSHVAGIANLATTVAALPGGGADESDYVTVAVRAAVLDRALGRREHWLRVMNQEAEKVEARVRDLLPLYRRAVAARAHLAETYGMESFCLLMPYIEARKSCSVCWSACFRFENQELTQSLLRRVPMKSECW
jgi:hypothetical protein